MTERTEQHDTLQIVPAVEGNISFDIKADTTNKGSGHPDIPTDISRRLQAACAGTRFTTLQDLKNRPRPDSLIEGLLVAKTLIALYGSSGVGKSFLAAEWAMKVATGLPVWGLETKPGLVFYVVAEGEAGFPLRIEAWKVANDCDPAAAITFLEMPLDLSDAQQVQAFINEIRGVEGMVDVPVALIVIDTLARCMSGQENSTDDMKRAVEAADTIRRELNTAVLLVHHSKKDDDENMRGSGVLWASAQTVIHLRAGNADDEIVATIKKQKDGPQASYRLALDRVECGIDEDGEPLGSLVVRYIEGGDDWRPSPRTARGPDHLTPSEQAMFDIVMAGGEVGISRREWHEAGEAAGIGQGRPATRNEAIKGLLSKGRAFEQDGRFYAAL